MSGTSATRRSPSTVSFGTPIFTRRGRLCESGAGTSAGGQRRQTLEGVELLAALSVDRRDDQAVDAGATEALDPLRHFGLCADQRGRLDDLIGNGLEGAGAVAVLEALLHVIGDLAEAKAMGQVDVEVGFAAAHT